MATAPNFPLVSVDEYLSSSYEHDVEFVEGILIERGMPTIAHSILQKLLLLYFAQYESAMGFVALPEVRTKIGNLARYRIPDVMLCPRPLPKGRICDVEPWVVVEVLSPDDTLAGTRSRRLRPCRFVAARAYPFNPPSCSVSCVPKSFSSDPGIDPANGLHQVLKRVGIAKSQIALAVLAE